MRALTSTGQWQRVEESRASFEPPVGNQVICEDLQFTAMVIREPNRRRDFHDDPSDEIFYMLRGAMTLEYIDVLVNPASVTAQSLKNAENQARSLEVKLQVVEARNPQEIDRVHL